MLEKRLFGSFNFYKDALKIAIPVMVQLLIQNLVSLVDNFMVSGLGDVKMSGVNIAGQIFFAFIVFLNTICMAGGIFMTQYSGANDKNGMKQAFCFKFFIGIFFVAILFFCCQIIPKNILSLMVVGNSQAESILNEGISYMKVISFVGIPMTVSTIIASSLREIGEVKAPLVISIIATCVNTFFNYLLIYGNFGFPRLEVQGAAIATIIARSVEMVSFLIYMKKRRPPFSINLKDFFNMNFKLIGEIIHKGWKILFSEIVWVLSETVTTALYNGRGGADVVSGMSASFAIANLFFIAFSGITTSTSVIIGKTLGKGELDEARCQKTWLLSGSVVFGIVMIFFGFATIALIPIVFSKLSVNSQEICKMMVFVLSLYMPIWVCLNSQYAVSRAGGDTAMGMWIDGITNLLFVIPGMFFMAKFTLIGPVMMYTIIKTVDFIKFGIAHFWLKKEKWVKNLAVQ